MASKTVLFTIGYEKRTPAEFVKALKSAGVTRLIDVRMTPWSRAKGFSAIALMETLFKAGIVYEHIKELGNPPEIRALFHAGELPKGRKKYKAFLSNGHSAYVDLLIGEAELQPTAIMCVERSHEDCHRDVIAEVATERAKVSLDVRHL